jgi:hypothetical protein
LAERTSFFSVDGGSSVAHTRTSTFHPENSNNAKVKSLCPVVLLFVGVTAVSTPPAIPSRSSFLARGLRFFRHSRRLFFVTCLNSGAVGAFPFLVKFCSNVLHEWWSVSLL